MKTQAGFTLIELLLTVTLLALIGGIGVPVYNSFQTRNSLDLAASAYTSGIRRAQIQARGMAGDSAWGVRVDSGVITIFKGSTYASRDTTYDETFTIPTSISLNGQQEFVFEKFTGLPLAAGSLSLTSSDNDVKAITVNQKGMVEY
jgi:prepilin-type N-terminal cleavage/methylation domain-containing protein